MTETEVGYWQWLAQQEKVEREERR